MITFNIIIFDKSNGIEYKQITKENLFNEIVPDMQERDMHIIDPLCKSNISVLLIKKNCILIKLDYLRCIITSTKLYISNSNYPRIKEFVEFLKTHYDKNKDSNNPFEFIILEAMLIDICNLLDLNVSIIANQVNRFLEMISKSIYNYKLSVPIQIELLKKEFRIKEVKDLITEILQSDEDMCNMYLTKNEYTQEEEGGVGMSPTQEKGNMNMPPTTQEVISPTQGGVGVSPTHEEIEALLENYEKLIDEINDKLKRMIREIDITQRIANLNLASTRNDIAILNTKFSMITISLSAGSLVSSVFGMNLKNHYEHNNITFFIVSGSIVLLFIFTIAILTTIYKVGTSRN